MSNNQSVTLLELNRRIADHLKGDDLQNVWVLAELSDVTVRGGHCYMELLHKDDSGATVARARATIWASAFRTIRAEFVAATGQDFASGMRLLLRTSVTMHPLYGMSMNVTAVNPDYTAGDLLRRRREMLQRLTAQGLIDINRSLCFPEPTLRIAVVSSAGAAGYGDFMDQLRHNPHRLRFNVTLFPATLQGDSTAPTVINALHRIETRQHDFDCVVIIRGGGATSDLMSFENYDLAATVASFPLPVVVGIGHERDITVLDYVACKRVKTPTAAAEWLIELGTKALDHIDSIGRDIVLEASQRLATAQSRLARMAGAMPSLALTTLAHATTRVERLYAGLQGISSRQIAPRLQTLSQAGERLALLSTHAVATHRQRLDATADLLKALSPEATLRRGYSITRVDGHALTDPSALTDGTTLVTTLANGTVTSTVISTSTKP